VRVIRGYQLKNAFSPEEGYRYDGKNIVFESFIYRCTET
jgi:hypothetical protein